MRRLLSILCLAGSLLTSLAAAEKRTPESAITPVDPSRHSQFLAKIAAAKGDFDLVLVGDSITDFWPWNGKTSYAQLAPWKPLNLGVTSERTEQVLWRLQNGELDNIHPKAVMVMIGTNNLGLFPDEKPEWAATGVAAILDTIKAKQPQAKILLLAIFPRSEKPTDPIRLRVEATNKLLVQVAAEKQVAYLDIGAKFLTPDGILTKEIMEDFLHPHERGYQIWLDAVKPTLAEMMR